MLNRILMAPGAWLAVVIGLAFSLIPTVGPFVAVLMLIGQPFAFGRQDVLWALAALVGGLPALLTSGLTGLLGAAGPIIAAWVVYRAFSMLPAIRQDHRFRNLSIGLIIGLAITVFNGWLQNSNLDLAYRTVAQAISWETNPALYGHSVLALGLAISLIMPFTGPRITALALAAFGVLVSGSREAGLAWLLFATLLPLTDSRMRQARQAARYYGVVTILLVFLAGVGTLLGWGRLGFLVDVVPVEDSEKNLIQGSEFPESVHWRAFGVEVEAGTVQFPDGPLTTYELVKTAEEPSSRLQQVVNLEAGQPYTVSAWFQPGSQDFRYGIQGWTELLDGATFSATGIMQNGDWVVRASRPSRILDSGIADEYGDWQRLWFSFVYEGEQSPVQIFLGLSPDNQRALGGTAQVAGFQLERGSEPTSYVPGSAARGVGLGSGRLPYWSAAWSGFLRSPLIGNSEAFPDYYQSLGRQRTRINEPPAHAHSTLLQTLYQYGLAGALSLTVFMAAVGWPAWNRKDHPSLLLLAAVLLANVFDTTLFYGGVLYPLVAVLGWRATVLGHQSSHERQRTARFFNSAGLVMASLAAPLLAGLLIAVIVGLRHLGPSGQFELPGYLLQPSFVYTCLLWPALAWREGLFPGYGISAPQQLRRHVTAALLAGLVFAVIATQFPASYDLSFLRVMGIVLLALVLMPLLHALVRRLLLRFGVWGEDIVILGAGRSAQRAVKALVDNPLIGLHPVAVFSHDTGLVGSTVHGVPVAGQLDESVEFARSRDIQHAVVAVPNLRAEQVGQFMDVTGRRFRRVQFIPDLPGLPAEEVSASNIDGILAIEFNNGLFSGPNQLAKRVMDIAGAGLLTILLFAPLLVVYLLIRLDSRGPGFYSGERVGKDGQTFKCLKFRTMDADADEQLPALLAADPAREQEYRRYHKLRNDPRVTRMGRWLRKYSIDELPQLVNVLRGEMSLIGARPYLVEELPAMGSYARVILQAKPGITGLWQVSGRNELSFQERLELEAHYVRNWTIWWDLIILGQTAEVIIGRP